MKSFSRSFLATITGITTKCENPNQVNQAMRHIMNQTMKLQHSRYVLDLYRELNKMNIGTNAIEHLAKKICYRLPEHRATTIKKLVMNWNIDNAIKTIRKARYSNTATWKQFTPILVKENAIQEFNQILIKEKGEYRERLMEKKKKKVDHLMEKYKVRRIIPDEVEGIIVRDQEIPACFTKLPKCYGKSEIDEGEQNVLSLPPKYAIYDRVDMLDCRSEIEKGITKYRWTHKEREEQRKAKATQPEQAEEQVPSTASVDQEDGEAQDDEEPRSRQIPDQEATEEGQQDTSGQTVQMEVQENNQEVGRISDRQYRMDKNFDFRYMKATDLPFNKRVYLPGPLEQDVEIQLQALKSKLEETTRAYIEEANKKNEKSNLS